MFDPEAVAVDVNETDIRAFLIQTTGCVSSDSFGEGFRQRCIDDEVSTHTC